MIKMCIRDRICLSNNHCAYLVKEGDVYTLGLNIGQLGYENSQEHYDQVDVYKRQEMDTISDTEVSLTVFEQLAKERDIEQLCNQGEYPKACDAMQAFIDELPPNDNLERGWYLQQLRCV